MSKLRKWTLLLTKSFRRKLIVSLACILLATSAITGYVTYRINLGLFEEEVSEQFAKANEQTLARLMLKINEVYQISQSIVFNPSVEQAMNRMTAGGSDDEYALYNGRKVIESQLLQMKTDAPYIRSLYLYGLQDPTVYFSYNNNLTSDLDEAGFELIRDKLRLSSGDLVWTRLQMPSVLEPSGVRNMIISARWMKNSQLQTYGVLIFVMDESFFSESLTELTEGVNGKVFLFDPYDQLLYADQGSERQARGAEHAGDDLSPLSPESVVKDPSYLYVTNRSRDYSFTLVSATSLAAIRQKSSVIIRVILLSGMLSLLMTGMLVAIANERLLRPLKDLLLGLKKIRSGDLDARIQVRTKDELAYIGESFNAMAEHVATLINEVYLRQLSEREAQLKAIQAQLNPHWLYNIFNEIYWKLYLHDEKEIAGILAAVSNMLKYSLKSVHSNATIEEELQQIRRYMKIQNELFENGVETVIQIGEEMLGYMMPRALLQPIVENAFVHGFRDKLSGKVLILKVSECENALQIDITDNGCGMDEKTVYLLNEGRPLYDENDRTRERIGVSNVKRRISLSFGEPYGLHVASKIGVGTTVSIRLPLIGGTPS
jgi:two-component system sensor histidine kinase YesM